MSMKKMLAVVAAASLVAVAAPAFAANPFSDVPMNHWAYDAVEELASKGVLEGYPNGTFKGNRAMTRYEIATMVARMMNAGLTGADLEKLKALVVEFQPELEALGVKVDGFDSRLSALEKGLGGWRISGQMRFDYNSFDYDDATDASGTKKGNNDSGFDMNRARLFLHRDLENKVSFDARYHNGEFDRWYFTARDFAGLEGLTVKGGQFALDWEGDDGLYIDNDGFFMDSGYRGFDIKYNRGMFTVEGFAASNKGGDIYDANEGDDLFGARMRFDFNEKLWLSVNALWTSTHETDGSGNNADNDYDVYWAGLGYKFLPGLELKGAYYIEDISQSAGAEVTNDDDPQAWKVIIDVKQDVLKFTSLWFEYNQIDKGFIMTNVPWMFNNRLDLEDYGLGTSDTTNTLGLKNRIQDDLDIYGVKLKQQWTPKFSSYERYACYDMDGDYNSVDEWTVGLGYQYSPNLYFELAYNDQDGKVTDDDYENKQIRFRTLLNF